MEFMALGTVKALGFVYAGREAIDSLMVAGIAFGRRELLRVRDLFDAGMAVRAGDTFVGGPFFEIFVAIETVIRRDGCPDGGTQNQEDDDKNRHSIPYRARETINAGNNRYFIVFVKKNICNVPLHHDGKAKGAVIVDF